MTSSHPLVFPSIPLSKTQQPDYVLFTHEITNIELVGTGKEKHKRPITYSELQQTGRRLERKCRLSEPFLAGVLAKFSQHLFRTGVPDFPDLESKRLKEVLK